LSALRLPAVAPPADVIVVGTGVAGLSVALAAQDRRVRLVTKGRLTTSGSSPWAQGGVAVALGDDDAPQLHAEDTLRVAGGVADAAAVRILTEEGPERIAELLRAGARFDRDGRGLLDRGREAAHSRRRILHAGGDATGRELVRALAAAVELAPWIEILEESFVEDLLLDDGRVVGVVVAGPGTGDRVLHPAGAVVLATGGIGQLYRHTTNPLECTGDGLAMAARAGARLADLEFVQFHPTALSCGRDPLPLLTEALRGEGAVLVDETGYRFMPEVDSRAELAPRDVVARAIWRRRESGHEVFLDAAGSLGLRFPSRFPTVFEECRRHGVDPRREPMPVTPAVHYHMGGVATDFEGRTSLSGLWAAGETACTGVHGANRLASNSLLEGLVFGHRVGRDVVAGNLQAPSSRRVHGASPAGAEGASQEAAVRCEVRDLLWRKTGLVRSAEGLAEAAERLQRLEEVGFRGELRNLVEVGRLVSVAALAREESRGAHYRADFPDPDPTWRRRQASTAAEILRGGDRPALREAAR
jgi:L-aspartate oxidase